MHSSESTTDTFQAGLSDLCSIKRKKRDSNFLSKPGKKEDTLQHGISSFHCFIVSPKVVICWGLSHKLLLLWLSINAHI